ncbi:hypothetical protein ANN_27757 [Periplaneta americana]|uniref:Uncharacterized protein n=1 Tax=Periplaneta americana TaxID=6978 RepID=A0ABQ8RV25_PERAM|nr:hypothetical protein ANN_27757 [Periplaneta americana]
MNKDNTTQNSSPLATEFATEYMQRVAVGGKCRVHCFSAQEDKLLDLHVTKIKQECVDESYGHTSEMKFEEIILPNNFPVVKCEAEERNILDQHATDIKEEYVNQNQDLTSEIKFEEDLVPIAYAMVKRDPEKEHSDLATVNKEQRLEETAEWNKVSVERIAATSERTVSEFDVLHMKRTRLCARIPRI